MASRLIIGQGELLTYDIPAPPMFPNEVHPYSFDEAKQVIMPQIQRTVAELVGLRGEACPHAFAVAKLLHPSYISNSFFPTALLRETGLGRVPQ